MGKLPVIHNIEMRDMMDEEGLCLATRQERTWLLQQLQRSEAASFFADDIWRTLLVWMGGCPQTQSAKNWLVLLRQAQLRKQFVQITRINNAGDSQCGTGVPLRLEYFYSRREWYMHWMEKISGYEIVPLRQIIQVDIMAAALSDVSGSEEHLQQDLSARTSEVVVYIPSQYQEEYWRLLCLFTCFNRQIDNHPAGGLLIKILYTEDDYRYVLMQLRRLGMRVQVISEQRIKEDLRADAEAALARYGEDNGI